MSNDECHTPDEFFDKLAKHFNFTLDAAATAKNTKCKKFITAAQDALVTPWKTKGDAWCNHPFSKSAGGTLNWLSTACSNVAEGYCQAAVTLSICDVSTAAYAFAWKYAEEIVQLSPRINFPSPGKKDRPGGKQAYFLSIWTGKPPERISLWDWKTQDFDERWVRRFK